MSRASIVINGPLARAAAIRWCEKAPEGTRITFQAERRSLDQNAKMWSMLSELAKQLNWHGIWLSPADWRLLFLDALRRDSRLVPNIDGNGFVQLGRSTSDLSKGEMSDLIELINAFAAKHGVIFRYVEAA